MRTSTIVARTVDAATRKDAASIARLGLRLYDDRLRSAETIRLAQQAEAQGYGTVWVPESAGKEAFTQLGAYAVSTRSLQLATGIVNVYTRSAAVIAMAVGTLDDLATGRAVLGLGSGHHEQLEHGHGVSFHRPFARLRDYVVVIRAILGGEPIPGGPPGRGRRFELGFSPERRRVPVYLAALGPKMCQLAGEIADGVLLNWASPDYVRRAVEHVRIGAERAGRSAGAVDIACYLRTAVHADSVAAEEALARQATDYVAMDVYRRMLEMSGFAEDTAAIMRALSEGAAVAARAVSDRLLAAVAIVGSDADRRARLDEYRRAGVTHPVIAPLPVGTAGTTLGRWQSKPSPRFRTLTQLTPDHVELDTGLGIRFGMCRHLRYSHRTREGVRFARQPRFNPLARFVLDQMSANCKRSLRRIAAYVALPAYRRSRPTGCRTWFLDERPRARGFESLDGVRSSCQAELHWSVPLAADRFSVPEAVELQWAAPPDGVRRPRSTDWPALLESRLPAR